MGIRIPGGKKPEGRVPGIDIDKMMLSMIIAPFSWLLSLLLGGHPKDWDTLEEIADNIIPAIIRRVLGPLGTLLGGGNPSEIDGATKDNLLANIPVIGPLVQAVTGIANGAMSTLQGFFSGFTKAAAGQNPGSGEGITSAISGIFNQQAAVANSASTAASAAAKARDDLATGANGRIVSQGVMEGLTYQLQVFTSNGTFTPPTPPTGKVISHFVGTAYGGGDSGENPGNVVATEGRGGRPGRRIARRISVEEMGSSQSVTVGAGGAPGGVGAGSTGSPSSIGSLLRSDSGAAGAGTPFGDLKSAGDPAEGGKGGMKVADGTTGGGDVLYAHTEGKRGEDGGGRGGVGGAKKSGWFGSLRSPGAGEQGAVVGDHTTGGGGGGGGAADTGGTPGSGPQSGAPGGAPAGGGGAAGSGNFPFGEDPFSGAGGRGQVDIATYFMEAPTA